MNCSKLRSPEVRYVGDQCGNRCLPGAKGARVKALRSYSEAIKRRQLDYIILTLRISAGISDRLPSR